MIERLRTTEEPMCFSSVRVRVRVKFLVSVLHRGRLKGLNNTPETEESSPVRRYSATQVIP